ncbi:MAG: MotA/TolQ/ExbB proton channel family protein [Bacteroidaceae bacterium]|nr:MotA/TolQ/ExbB proton channel family protein [Bacteroidaceae bacterium]
MATILSYSTTLTYSFLAFIVFVFIRFLIPLRKITLPKKLIIKSLKSDDILGAFNKTKLEGLGNLYKRDITTITQTGKKTNTPASYYFNTENVTNAYNLNLIKLDSASSTLVGLGLLGTFLGLTIGIIGFDSSDSSNIQQSIQNLLEGMGTAFSTSLLGMLCSLIFTAIYKAKRDKLHKCLNSFTEKLDTIYFIDDNELQDLNQSALIDRMIKAVQTELNSKLSYNNDEGENVPIGNAVREILKESYEQSKALKSFSTDLAMELNNGFDEVLSRQMQAKILPLMESVDATTKAVIEHIDQMASTVSSPASSMMQNVVDELKKSMVTIIEEFRSNISGSATSQMEALAMQLGAASQSIGEFPRNMELISNTLQNTIEDVRTAITDISNNTANANSATMQQMQEQSNQIVDKLAEATDKMGTFLNSTITNLSTSVQDSMKSITEDVSNKQADLIALQEDTTSQTKKLLDSFNDGLARLEKMSDYIIDVMNGFRQAQGEITLSTGNLRTISNDMRTATETFNKGQLEYAERINQLQTSSQRGIEKVEELLVNSGQMSEEYAQKFDVIKQGLTSIFSQLQNGLTEYSRTVQATTQKYLDQYTTNLTQTTDALSSTIQQQNDVVEMLNEILTHKR